MMASESSFAATGIFEKLQEQIDEDVKIQETLRELAQELDNQNKIAKSILSRAHSTKSSEYAEKIFAEGWDATVNQRNALLTLAEEASIHPYYRWNHTWSRQVQDTIFSSLFWTWLGGKGEVKLPQDAAVSPKVGELQSLEDLCKSWNVLASVKEDKFHISIEEYLHGLISLVDELARLARNAVILQDYALPPKICEFVKEVQAGFMLLNLKNDSLRKRFDSIKYKVKEVEDVVYDLSLRNLLPNA